MPAELPLNAAYSSVQLLVVLLIRLISGVLVALIVLIRAVGVAVQLSED